MTAPAATCNRPDLDLVGYAAGELPTLDAQRVRAHLGHCATCSALLSELEQGLCEAKAWQPQVSAEHLEVLNTRLGPYLERPAAKRLSLWPLGLGFAALLLALSVGFVAWWAAAPLPSTSQMASANPQSQRATQTANDAATPRRRALAPHLRMVTSAGWDGSIAGEADDLSVSMDDGFAVFAFQGGTEPSGQRRRLRIWTPEALVEVVGTRFFVEITTGTTHIGVAQGRVRVLTRSGDRVLRAGDDIALDHEGKIVEVADGTAATFLDHPFLMPEGAHREDAQTTSRIRPKPRRKTPARADSGPDVFAQLQAAQKLAHSGQHRGALEAYRRIADDPRRVFGPYRDICRYEMARLHGFELGEYAEASALLLRLKRRGRGEAARQASLALCELQLKRAPCEAARCLRALMDESEAEFDVIREAQGLLASWHLDRLACDPGDGGDNRLK